MQPTQQLACWNQQQQRFVSVTVMLCVSNSNTLCVAHSTAQCAKVAASATVGATESSTTCDEHVHMHTCLQRPAGTTEQLQQRWESSCFEHAHSLGA